MTTCTTEEALTVAEKACRDKLATILTDTEVYRFANPGVPDCAVFDIGYSYAGDLNTFNAKAYHWRGSLFIYRRDHDAVQKAVMRLIAALPIGESFREDDALRDGSNVLQLRIAPEVQAIGPIRTTDVQPEAGKAPIPAYTCEVKFDVVFAARF